jgi:hypothetical protein
MRLGVRRSACRGRAARAAGQVLYFCLPVAVLLLAVLHIVADEEDPAGIVARLAAALAPWS